MAPTKIKKLKTESENERLRKKREKERERRRKIREDPIKREEQKCKDHQKYLKQREKMNRKQVKDMSEREKRQIRKKWRNQKQSSREKKKNCEKENEHLQVTSPFSDEEPKNMRAPTNARCRNRNKMKRYKEKQALIEQNKTLKRRLEMYKKRYQRIKASTACNAKGIVTPDTPNTRVRKAVITTPEMAKNPQAVKKMLFGEVVGEHLANTYRILKSNKERQVFKKMMTGKVLRKYKMESVCKKVIKYRKSTFIKTNNFMLFERKNRFKSQQEIRKKIIAQFLEEDEHSRQCPGKKDYITRKKVVKQKRYLSNTLKNLHIQFKQRYPSLDVSYCFFCRSCPFWIRPMKVNDRDTCACVIDANMDLIVHSLHKNGVLCEKNSCEVLQNICCNYKSNSCLSGACKVCNDSACLYNNFDGSLKVIFQEWGPKQVDYVDKKTKQIKTVKKILKHEIETTLIKLVNIFQNKLTPFKNHQARLNHQYNTIRKLKEELAENELLIHCDFSENYNTKYGKEIQSFHFGGSRMQISMHTVVVYSRNETQLISKSFCTLSDCLKHDAPAIWAHLYPVIKFALSDKIDTLHFLSDGPSGQYRNKTMFAFLGVHLSNIFPFIKIATWNYHETGHGKGAPDGVGGVCKKTADRIVAQGTDVPDLKTLATVLDENCPSVTIFTIDEKEIEYFSDMCNGISVPFKGVLKIHQVRVSTSIRKIWLRTLSCFNVKCSGICSHYGIGEICYIAQESPEYNANTIPNICDKPTVKQNIDTQTDFSLARPSLCKLRVEEIYSSETEDSDEDLASLLPTTPSVADQEIPSCSYHKTTAEISQMISKPTNFKSPKVKDVTTNVLPGTYVLVELEEIGKKTIKKFVYVAVCTTEIAGEDVQVLFLKETSKNTFIIEDTSPFIQDGQKESYIKTNQIIKILPQPSLIVKGQNRIHYKFPCKVHVSERK